MGKRARQLDFEFISEFELPHTCTQFEYIKDINSAVFGAFVKSNEKELSEWQVGIQNPSIMEPGFYQGLVPDFKLGDRNRESGVIKSFAYGEVYSFTNNRKLGAGTDKLLGLVHTDIEELKERYKKNDLSAVDCKSIRTKPLLLIYEVNATLEGKSVFEEKPVSFGVFLPEVGTADALPVTYSVNKIAQN